MDDAGDEGVADLDGEGVDDSARHVGERIGDAINAEHAEWNQPAKDETIRLGGEEPESGAEKDPFAEVDDLLERGAIPAEVVGNARGDAFGMAERNLVEIGGDIAGDERPYRRGDERPCDCDQDGDDLHTEVDGEEPTDAHMAGEREQVGAVETGEHHAEGQEGQHIEKARIVVEPAGGPGEGDGQKPEDDSTNGLE